MKSCRVILSGFLLVLLSLVCVLAIAQQSPRLECEEMVGANYGQLPETLKALVRQYYPPLEAQHLLKYTDPSILDQIVYQDNQLSWWEHVLSPNGPDLTLVAYCGVGLGASFRVFSKDSQGTYHYFWGANPELAVAGEDLQVLFQDIDKNGVDEVLIYSGRRGHGAGAVNHSGIWVLAYNGGTLVPIVPHETIQTGGITTYLSLDEMESTEDVGFLDLDGDGIAELLIYPSFERSTEEIITPDGGESIAHGHWLNGTRVYKLVNGMYTFQYETPVGTSTFAPVGAAMKPASVPLAELQGAGGGNVQKSGGGDDALTLQVMPPGGYSLEDVDWPSLRVGDFAISSTRDAGASPAPYPPPTYPQEWMPTNRMGQNVLLEDLAAREQGEFAQKNGDPTIYIGVRGRVHMTTPYRELRFSKKAVFAWLWQQWHKGAANMELKGCLPQGNHRVCFTPLTLPIRVTLKNNKGFALGAATLWIETKEDPSCAKGPVKAPSPEPAKPSGNVMK